MKKTLILSLLIISAAFFGCKSTVTIPLEATYTQLIQMGQDSIEYANYSAAESYYLAAIQRYGMDTNVYIEAKYELGRLYLTQEKWEKAFAQFNEILSIYENADFGTYPQAYNKLCKLSIEQIPEKHRK